MQIEPKPNPDVKHPTSQNIDWYSEGETRIVNVNGVEVRIRFIGRKGRRGRILLEAPAGAQFTADAPDNFLAAVNDPDRNCVE